MWALNYSSVKEITEILGLSSLAMTKKFGQNFLTNASFRQRIADLALAGSPSLVWEIGPGLGAITSLLLKGGVQVRAFEIDHGFCSLLRGPAFGDEAGFTLVEGDALKTLITQPDRPEVVCGNLPYNVGSICIARLIEEGILPERMVFTLQKEVVERMCAQPGDEAWSSFSILTQVDYINSLAFTIGRANFYPSPNVDSAVVLMRRRQRPLVEGELRRRFLSLVRILFSQRRKTIRNNLAQGGYGKDALALLLERCGLSGSERAEALPIDKLIEMASALQ